MARRKDALNEELATGPDDSMSAEATVDPQPVAEPAALPIEPPPPPAVPRRSGVLGPLLGGALAAIGGFALSHYNVLGLAAPDQSAQVTALADRLAVLEAQPPAEVEGLRVDLTAALERLAALESAPAPPAPDLSGLEQRLAAIEAMPAEGGDASMAALAAKLAELERRLAVQPPAADQAEVDAALARLEAAEAEAKQRAEEATAAAAAAAQAAALNRLRAKVTAGEGFETELAALTDPDLQAALAPHVAGVAPLETLQADFPEAARLALQLDRTAAEGDGWGARLVDFLAAQTGARSVAPREGTDPDAILSRAEFALSEGRLDAAVTEVKALDPTLQAPFADWQARAEARLAALAALEGK